MHLFTLAYRKMDEIIVSLKEIIDRYSDKGKKIGLLESVNSNVHFIKIIIEEEEENISEKWVKKLYYEVSDVIYKLLLKEYEEKYLNDFIEENYYLIKEDEINTIKEMAMIYLQGEGTINSKSKVYSINRKNKIINDITSLIKESKEINIDGFIKFRFKEYESIFNITIENIIEKYLVEKEYQEFIRLLKYFVDLQECKIEIVNIYVNSSGEFEIQDGFNNNIELEEMAVDKDFKSSNEDLLMSSLVSSAPNKIIIHGEENIKNEEFRDTIFKVFEERIEVCDYCDKCKMLDDNKKKLVKKIGR